MSDHYSGHDPLRGCGIGIAIVLFAVAVFWVLVLMIVGHLLGAW